MEGFGRAENIATPGSYPKVDCSVLSLRVYIIRRPLLNEP